MAAVTVVAFVGIEPQEEYRDTIEKAEYRAQRAENCAPGSVFEKDGHRKKYQYCAL
jgi:hypothetical protein